MQTLLEGGNAEGFGQLTWLASIESSVHVLVTDEVCCPANSTAMSMPVISSSVVYLPLYASLYLLSINTCSNGNTVLSCSHTSTAGSQVKRACKLVRCHSANSCTRNRSCRVGDHSASALCSLLCHNLDVLPCTETISIVNRYGNRVNNPPAACHLQSCQWPAWSQ